MGLYLPHETTFLGFVTPLTIYEDLTLKTGIRHIQFANMMTDAFINLIRDHPGAFFMIPFRNNRGEELRTYLHTTYEQSVSTQMKMITGMHLGTKEDFEGLGWLEMAEKADKEYDLQRVVKKIFNPGDNRVN